MESNKNISFSEAIKYSRSMARAIEMRGGCDFIVGVSRGGLIPAAIVATKLDIPLITVYIDRKNNIYLDRKEWINKSNIIVIDDIIRTGKTLEKIISEINSCGAKSVKSYVLYSLKDIKRNVFPFYERSTEVDVNLPWDY